MDLKSVRTVLAVCLLWVSYDVARGETSDSQYVEAMDQMLKGIMAEYESFSTEMWHPVIDVGYHSREAVRIQSVSWLTIDGNYQQWEHATLGQTQLIFGRAEDRIDVYDQKLAKRTTILNGDSSKFLSMGVLAMWNEKASQSEVFCVVGSANALTVHKYMNNNFTLVGSWPVYYELKSISVCQPGYGTVARIIVEPLSPSNPIDVYNFEPSSKNGPHFWFLQHVSISSRSHLTLQATDSTCNIVAVNGSEIVGFTFDESSQLFQEYTYATKLAFGCEKPTSLMLEYTSYLGCISSSGDASSDEERSIVRFLPSKGVKNEVIQTAAISATEIASAPVGDFRSETILIAKDSKDLRMYSYDARTKSFVLGFTCSADSCTQVSQLLEGDGVPMGGDTYYFSPAAPNANTSLVFRIKTEVFPFPSPVFERTHSVRDELVRLARRFEEMHETLEDIKRATEDSLHTEGDVVITGDWYLNELNSYSVHVETAQSAVKNLDDMIDSITFWDTTLHQEDFGLSVESMQNDLDRLTDTLKQLEFHANKVIPLDSDHEYTVSAPQEFTDQVTVETLGAEKLSAKLINLVDVNELLVDLVNYPSDDSGEFKIPCNLTFAPGAFRARNVYSDTVGNLLTHNFAYKSDNNHFTSPIMFTIAPVFKESAYIKRLDELHIPDDVLLASDVSGVELELVKAETADVKTPIGGHNISQSFADSFLRKDAEQEVTCHTIFREASLLGDNKVNQINQNDLEDFVTSLIFKSHEGIIHGTKTVDGPLCHAKTLAIRKTLNDLRFPNDYVRNGSEIVILKQGKKTFHSFQTDEMKIDGFVDGVKTDEWVLKNQDNVLVLNTTWDCLGNVHFLDGLTVTNSIGRANVASQLLSDTLDRPGQSVFQPNHDIVFSFPVEIDQLQVNEKINGDTAEDLLARHVLCENGKDLRIPGTIIFETGAYFNNVTLEKNGFNNIALDDLLQRFKTKEQVFTGSVTFGENMSFDVLKAHALFDGVDLSAIHEQAVYMLGSETLPPGLKFESLVFLDEAEISGPINGLETFGSDVAVNEGRDSQEFESSINAARIEAQSFDVDSLTTNVINDFNWHHWLERRISLSSGHEFNSSCEFDGHVTFPDSSTVSTINGYPLNYFLEGVLRTDVPEQVFSATVFYEQPLAVHALITQHEMNGYEWNAVVEEAIPVDSNETQVITGDWYMEHPVFHDLEVLGNVCGVNLTELAEDAVYHTDDDPVFYGDIDFHGRVKMGSLEADSVNDESDYFGKFLRKAGDQEIKSPIVWLHGVNVSGPSTILRINSISYPWLNSLEEQPDGTYVSNEAIDLGEHRIAVTDLFVAETIQGINWDRLMPDLVCIHESCSTSGYVPLNHLKFTESIKFQTDVDCDVYNGLNLKEFSDLFVLQDSNFEFTYPVRFAKSLTTGQSVRLQNGNVIIPSDVIGGYNLTEWEESIILLNDTQTVELEQLEFADPMYSTDGAEILSVNTLNGMPSDAYFHLDKSYTIETIQAGVLKLDQEDLQVSGLFGGCDVEDLAKKTIRITSQQGKIFGHKHFKNMVIANKVTSGDGSNTNLLVYLNNATVYSPLKFHGKVDAEDFHLKGKWNGEDLDELNKRAAHIDQDEQITGRWLFSGGLHLENQSHAEKLIGGIDFSEAAKEYNKNREIAQGKLESHLSDFQNVCSSLRSVRHRLEFSPMKLQSVDEQQVFTLAHEAKKVLTVNPGPETFLLSVSNCGANVYLWSKETEQFHVHGDILTDFSILDWKEISHEEQKESFLVFSSESSTCSSEFNNSGLYLSVINATGESSTAIELWDTAPIHFELQMNLRGTNGLVFVVPSYDPQRLTLMSIDLKTREFHLKSAYFQAPEHVLGLQIFAMNRFSAQVVLMLSTGLVQVEFQKKASSFVQLHQEEFHGSPKILKTFHVHNEQYVLVSTRERTPRAVQPSNTLQLFGTVGGRLELVQSLESYNVKSCDIVYLTSSQVYVAVLTDPGHLTLYKFMGMSGLVPVEGHPTHAYHGETVHTFYYQPWNYHTRLPFILVAGKNVVRLYHCNVVGQSESNHESLVQLNQLCGPG